MKSPKGVSALALLILAALAYAVPRSVAGERDEQEQLVTLDQLPPAVRATLWRESTGGRLGKIARTTEDHETIYEADVTLDGRDYEARVAADGLLLKKELEGKSEASRRLWTFERDKVGSVPKGWEAAETSGEGTLATWHVVTDTSAPSPSHAVAITANKNYGGTFNLLLAEDTSYGDLEIEVMLKAITGQDDQGGGPVWRARDADNYYVCRWNPLEDNFRLYYVKNGRRRTLASAMVKTDPRAWHKIAVEQKGTRIECTFDGKKLLEVEDSTFSKPGMVGLWVKADGRSEFDNVKVADLSGPSKAEAREEGGHKQEVPPSEGPAGVPGAANNAMPGVKPSGEQ